MFLLGSATSPALVSRNKREAQQQAQNKKDLELYFHSSNPNRRISKASTALHPALNAPQNDDDLRAYFGKNTTPPQGPSSASNQEARNRKHLEQYETDLGLLPPVCRKQFADGDVPIIFSPQN